MDVISVSVRSKQKENNNKRPKSPLIFLTTMAVLIVSTLVVASAYFLKPTIESELADRLIQRFSLKGLVDTKIKISGRDVTLIGYVSDETEAQEAEAIAKQISGIREVENKLLIKTYSTD